MAQTLNFAVHIDQSQLPSAIQQIQGGINTQLQAGALQLGTMANGLSATMAGMNVLGVSPSSMGFAHAMAPGQVNYSLGRQPFVDRTASMLDFMNSASGAVKARASSIVASMDPSKIAPTINSDPRWKQTLKAVGTVGLGIAGMSLGGWALGAGAAAMGLTGIGWSTVAGAVGYQGGQYTAGKIAEKAGWTSQQFSAEELQKLTIERRGYADIAGAFMALGPQKYLPKMGMELDTKGNLEFGKSIADAFLARKDFSIVSRAAGSNPSYLTDVISTLAMTDPAGYNKHMGPLHKYAGSAPGAAPDHLLGKAVSYFNAMELSAQAAGFGSVSSERYKRTYTVAKNSEITAPSYKGPNMYQLMGEKMGMGLRMGKQFGSEFISSLRSRVEKDLGLSPDERRMVGGNSGIAGQYGSVVLREMGTFGSSTNLAYAAMYSTNQSGGKLGSNIYDMNTQAAGVFTDPKQYVKFRLNYKEIVRGAGANDSLYRRNQVMIAREMMAQSGGAFENEHDALRIMFEGQGMDAEQARVQAGMILGVGTTMAVRGGTGAKVKLSNVLRGNNLTKAIEDMIAMGYTKEQAESLANKTVFSKKLFPSDLTLEDSDIAGYKAWKGGAADIGGKFAKMEKTFLGMGANLGKEVARAGTPEAARTVIRKYQLSQSLLLDPFVTSGGIDGISVLKKISDRGGTLFDDVKALNQQIRDLRKTDPVAAHEKSVELSTLLQNTGDSLIRDKAGMITGLDLSTVTRENVEQYKNAGISTFNADGKGKPGEYDIDVAEKDWNAGIDQLNKGIKDLFKIVKQKGK